MQCAALLLAISLFGCGEPKERSYFRAQLNDAIVEGHIHDFAYWREIQSKEVDIAFETYQKGPHIQKRFAQEASTIFQLIGRGGLLGVAAEAHEKWEVLEYLKGGYSLEDIGNGKAYAEYKPHAHAIARYKELRLYQFWYALLFGDKPPAMKAFLFVHPVLKIIVEDIYQVETTTEVMDGLMRELRAYEGIARTERSSKEDISRCIRFFEGTGYDYGAQRSLFLDRGLIFLEKVR